MAKAQTKIKGKKKRWFQIIAPKLFRQQVLGELTLYEPHTAMGRCISANLMSLTGDMKRQNVNIKFIINNIGEGKLYTDIAGYEVTPTSIKRMVRRRSSKISLSFLIETGDGKKARIKPILLTRGDVKQSVLTKLRKETEEAIKSEAKKAKLSILIEDLVNHRLQVGLKKHLNKLHPIRTVEIKELKLLAEGTPVTQPKKTAPEEAEEVKKPKKARKEAPKEEESEAEEEPKEPEQTSG
jgi:small subunit ribosomal protein S3Ae